MFVSRGEEFRYVSTRQTGRSGQLGRHHRQLELTPKLLLTQRTGRIGVERTEAQVLRALLQPRIRQPQTEVETSLCLSDRFVLSAETGVADDAARVVAVVGGVGCGGVVGLGVVCFPEQMVVVQHV